MATLQLIGTLLVMTLIGYSATSGSDATDGFNNMLPKCGITAQAESKLDRPQEDALTAQADVGFVSPKEEDMLALSKQQQRAEFLGPCL
jgi:hypothetical protein